MAASVGELEDQLEEVSRRARAASVIMPDKGEQMLQQARRARDIVRELSNAFLLVPPGPRRDVDLVSLVEESVEAALDEGLPLHVSLEGLAGLPLVHGDPRALSAAISHLLRNASQATPGGVLRIRGTHREGQVELRFADDGPGVPAALRAEIFDPFFTTRRVGEGVGLGLTLVHFVARGHGGSIVVEDSTSGACFALRLPARDGGAGRRRARFLALRRRRPRRRRLRDPHGRRARPGPPRRHGGEGDRRDLDVEQPRRLTHGLRARISTTRRRVGRYGPQATATRAARPSSGTTENTSLASSRVNHASRLSKRTSRAAVRW